MLQRLVYVSRSTEAMDSGDLIVLLDVARTNNQRVGVTGMLLYVDRTFLQLLEGPAEGVDDIFGRILTDPRHTLLRVLTRTEVEQREFADWAMGFEDSEAAELERYLPGYVAPKEEADDVDVDVTDAEAARILLQRARTRGVGRLAVPR